MHPRLSHYLVLRTEAVCATFMHRMSIRDIFHSQLHPRNFVQRLCDRVIAVNLSKNSDDECILIFNAFSTEISDIKFKRDEKNMTERFSNYDRNLGNEGVENSQSSGGAYKIFEFR